MARTPLAESHVEALRRLGREVTYRAGETIVALGSLQESFLYLLEGEAAAFTVDGAQYSPHTLGPTQFVGEIAFLNNTRTLLEVRAVQNCRLIEVPRDEMLELMAKIPEMSDIIVMVFAGRRRGLLERSASNLTLIGADDDRTVGRVAAFASRNRIPFRSIALDDPDAARVAQACSMADVRPAVVYGADVVEDPTPRKIATLMGVDQELDADQVFDVVIVGGGPAGIAAGVYAGSEGLCALVLEDVTIGGQAGTSSRIENFMGFPTGISGADLCWRGEVQAMRFGTRFAMPRRACSLAQESDGTFVIDLEDTGRVRARAVVVATGVQYRRLPIERLADFEGSGVYYAATDLEARSCRSAPAIVIGGGNSAGQAAMFLSRSASHVHVLIRGQSLAASMSSYLSERLVDNPSITIHYGHEVAALHGTDSRLQSVTVMDKASDQPRRLDASAMFVMVGAAPNTKWLAGAIELDNKGFVKTGPAVGGRSTYETSLPGVFAVGDVRAGSTKRVASGVGEGSVVIASVWKHVHDTL